MSSQARSTADTPTTGRIWLALGIVYVVWSTTYLTISVVNETVPPLLGAGVRFTIAGALLYAWSVRRGDRAGDRPGRRQWLAAAIVGIGLIVCGNGFVALSERTVPTGIVALLIALVPLWMALIDRVLGNRRIGGRTFVGLALGFGGAALLVSGNALQGAVPISGMLLAVAASLCWASGSLYSRNAPLPHRPLVGIGMEFLVGGLALFVVAGFRGEFGQLDVGSISRASLLGELYLIVIASWIAFASYLWLLRVARTSLVSTYAYVNPAFAVVLGAVFLDEAIGWRTLVAGGVILVAVMLIISAGGAARDDLEDLEAEVGVPADAKLDGEAGSGGVEQRRAERETQIGLQDVRDPEHPGLLEDGGGQLQPDG
jgi:drug/metabolite transporter (DMT)-like permease